MRLTFLRPMMWTEDLDATTAFYVDVLGFTWRCTINNGYQLQFGQQLAGNE